MAKGDGYTGFYWVGGLAMVTFLIIVGYSAHQAEESPVAPVPTATTMRTATQGPRTTYPVCEDVEVPPCVQVDTAGAAWLITGDGVTLPAIVVTRDEKTRPRMVTIR